MHHVILKQKYLKASDDFRAINKDSKAMSHFYEYPKPGMTRIDRAYSYGGIKPVTAFYTSPGFTDHLALVVSYELPKHIERKLLPRSCPYFKVKPYVLEDPVFRQQLEYGVKLWMRIHDEGVPILEVWEHLVKPGI